jgi:hypothetical protein
MEFETVNIVCMGLYVTRVGLVPDFSSMEFKKNLFPLASNVLPSMKD